MQASAGGSTPSVAGLFARVAEDTVLVEVDENLYALEALFKTCYVFTDRAYLYLRRSRPGVVDVLISPKEQGIDLEPLAGEFCNELLDYRVRSLVSAETGKIREIIVAQAFAEGNLLEDLESGSDEADDYNLDPSSIGDYREGNNE